MKNKWGVRFGIMKKNKVKKIIAFIFAVIFAAQFCFYAAAAVQPVRNISNFYDVSQGDWYYSYVKRLYEDGVINGVTENSYAPNADVKTSEVVALVARYLGLEYIAEKNREFLINAKTEGANLWYSGYIQLLFDTGIFGDNEIINYGIRMTQTGEVIIPDSSAMIIDSPIKRMDMVKLIAGSFEIKKGGTASNRLKSEISGTGNEFITGGGYDGDTLGKIKDMISDYDNIPEEYKEYFLKCYYNGIVRGNERSEVLPYNNLKRSELAKIISTVMYFDLRENDIRSIPAVCVITQNDYSVSSVDGTNLLKKEKAEQILKEQAKNIKTAEDKDKNAIRVTVNQNNIIPKGYLSEIYIYMYIGGAAHEMGKINCSTNEDAYFPKQNSFNISKSNLKSNSDFVGYVYLVLRDLNRGGEIAGAVMLNIDPQGSLKDTQAYDLP